MLTLLAWHERSGELSSDHLPEESVADFLRADSGAALEGLIAKLAERFNLGDRESSLLQAFGRFCLTRLEEESGSDDPDYNSCFLISG
jgi:hypothetical protein